MTTTKARNLSIRSHFGADRHSLLSLPTLYFAVFNGDPEGAGVEPTSVGGYARVAVTNDATTFGTIAATATSVNAQIAIVFPTLTALWSQTSLTHWAVFDNNTGGNLWYSGKLGQTLVVTGAGDVPRIPAGSFSMVAN